MAKLKFVNNTSFIAQFVVHKGEQVVARLPGVAPHANMSVPSDDIYQVTATTILEGNTYTTAPVQVSGAKNFIAQVKQNYQQGTYDFEMKVDASAVADKMVFQKTTIAPVTFNILKDGKHLQSVVVEDSFRVKTLQIGTTYTVYAVVNGVTTDVIPTSDPDAVITAELDDTQLEAGYFTLAVA